MVADRVHPKEVATKREQGPGRALPFLDGRFYTVVHEMHILRMKRKQGKTTASFWYPARRRSHAARRPAGALPARGVLPPLRPAPGSG